MESECQKLIRLSFMDTSSEKPYRHNLMSTIIPQIRPDIDLAAYKMQRLCKICLLNLKETKLNAKTKKYHCKFCGEAVCSDCSSVKVYSVDTRNMERICLACLNEELSDMCRKEAREEIKKINQLSENEKLVNYEGIETNKQYLQELKHRVAEKKTDLGQTIQKIKDLQTAIAEEESKNLPMPDNTRKIQRLSRRVKTEHSIQIEIESNQNCLSALENDLKSNISSIKTLSSKLKETQSQAECRNNIKKSSQERSILLSQLSLHRGLISTYKVENEKLKEKIGSSNKKR